MMKKKIALITALILAYSSVGVNAAIETKYDYFTKQITVKGTHVDEEEGRPIAILVDSPASTDESSLGTKVLQFAQTSTSGEDGAYQFDFEVNFDISPSATVEDTYKKDAYGEYTIKIGGYNLAVAESDTIYIPSPAEVNTMLANLSTPDVAEAGEDIDEYAKRLHLNEDITSSVNETEFARVVGEEARKNGAYTSADMAATHQRLKRSAVVAAFNAGQESLVYNQTTKELLNQDVLGLPAIDSAGVTLYNTYNTALSQEGKVALKNELVGQSFNTYDDFLKKFKEQVMLKAVQYPVDTGIAYISNLITSENAAAINMTATEFLNCANKDGIASRVARQSYATVFDLQQAIIPLASDFIDTGWGETTGAGTPGGYYIPDGNAVTPETDVPVDMEMFKDVPTSHWLYSELYKMKTIGIVSGSDGYFYPNNQIKREEFVKMLCEAFEIPNAQGDVTFTDVVDSAWYKKYVDSVSASGVVNGMGDGTFGIGQNISRQDLCVMVYRAVNGASENVGVPMFSFSDAKDVADYAKDAINYMYMTKILTGYEDKTIKPANPCTRAEAAKIIYATMEHIKEVKAK